MTTFSFTILICAAVTGLLHYGLRGHRYAWFMLGALVPMAIIAMLGHFELLHPRVDPVRERVRGYCEQMSDDIELDLAWHKDREQRWLVVHGHRHRFHFCALLRPKYQWDDDAAREFLRESAAYREDGDETHIDRISARADEIARQVTKELR